jgi:hypothetical protein
MLLKISRKNDDGSYLTVYDFPSLPICQLLGGFNFLPFFNSLLDDVKEANADLLKICSMTGDIKLSNIALTDSSFLELLSDGEYKIETKFYDSVDENIITGTVLLLISHGT